jgi:Mobilization protein NikA
MLSKRCACPASNLSAFVNTKVGADQKDITLMKRPKLIRVITFRVTDADWLAIQKAAEQAGETPNDWCRTTALERLDLPGNFRRSERIIFAQAARVGWLVENAFQLLADDNLEPNLWKNYRAYAKQNVAAITDQAIEDHASSTKR